MVAGKSLRVINRWCFLVWIIIFLCMKTDWPTKNLGEIVVGIIFIIFAVILFLKGQYGYSVLLIALLLILLKLDELTDFAFSFKDGVSAKFGVSKEKIEENIKENNEATTPENLALTPSLKLNAKSVSSS